MGKLIWWRRALAVLMARAGSNAGFDGAVAYFGFNNWHNYRPDVYVEFSSIWQDEIEEAYQI